VEILEWVPEPITLGACALMIEAIKLRRQGDGVNSSVLLTVTTGSKKGRDREEWWNGRQRRDDAGRIVVLNRLGADAAMQEDRRSNIVSVDAAKVTVGVRVRVRVGDEYEVGHVRVACIFVTE